MADIHQPAPHGPDVPTEAHPKPTPSQARRHARMRHAEDDRTQAAIWNVFLLLLIASVTAALITVLT